MYSFRLASKLTTMSLNGSNQTAIESGHLAELIEEGNDATSMGRLIIIDCRRFLDYNASHIRNAINICYSKLIRKRLQENKMSILDIIRTNCADSKQNVVLYGMDGCNDGVRKCQDDVSFLKMLMDKLNASSRFQTVRMLKGGFVDFRTRYPELCESASRMETGSNGTCVSNGNNGFGIGSKLTLSSLSQPCLPVSNQGPTKILPFLYLGSQQDAMDQETLTKHGIDYVLNMSVSCPKPDFVQDEHFMRIAVNDSHSEKLLPYFERAFEFLDKVKEANSCVLVHCLAGISRSPTLAIAFVMRHLHMSSEDAYRYVKEKRPAISPNFNFLGQLLEYEKQLKNCKQNGQRHSFNSLTPNGKSGSKTAASTPDNSNVGTKPLLCLNLQNTNGHAKCSCGTTDMKRSSSCPVKIQKNGTSRETLNLDFEFSPTTKINVNGKRQRIQPGMAQIGKEDELRCFMEKLDKIPMEKFLNVDNNLKRVSSPIFKALRPLHEELPSPSTELSKLNFNCRDSSSSASSEMETMEDGNSFSCPPQKVQIKNDRSFLNAFANFPKSNGKFGIMCKENPIFSNGAISDPKTAQFGFGNGMETMTRMEDGNVIQGKDEKMSMENPLFTSTFRDTFKEQKWPRPVSLSDNDDEISSIPEITTEIDEDQNLMNSGMRSVRSESHLASSSDPTEKLEIEKTKNMGSARNWISNHLRHFVSKRASWPNVVSISSCENETSATKRALAPPSTETNCSKNRISNESKKSKIIYIRGHSTPAGSGMGSRLAPSVDTDSPESGFVERDSSGRTTVKHAATTSSVCLHGDSERDNFGSTSSLEITVS